jgi:hypothetical protein
MDNKKYAYSILEKLVEPNLNIIYSKNFKKYYSKIIMKQIFDGLNFIVSNKYMHDDINMRNIGIGEDKNVRIFDFGSAYYNDINNNNYKVSMIVFKIELANLYNIFGEKNKAASLYEECFENIMKSLSNDNPNTLCLMKKIANLYNEGNRGILMFEEYFEKNKQLRGNDNPFTLQVTQSIADFHFKLFAQKSDFDDLPNPNDFEQVYIGIGAKFYTSDYPIQTNTGPFQLYPNLVNSEKTALIIIIDPQLDVAVETQKYVERSILRSHDFSLINTTYVMIKAKFNKTMSEKMISYLRQRPSADKMWICSFVTFMSSSATFIERAIENNIDAFFENKDMPYNKNSYKWLGYSQPYILRKYFVENSIHQYRGVSLIKKPKTMDPDKYLNFCYEENTYYYEL